jgi:hypothetical protein
LAFLQQPEECLLLNRQFYEFWGQYFTNVAKGQKQLEEIIAAATPLDDRESCGDQAENSGEAETVHQR